MIPAFERTKSVITSDRTATVIGSIFRTHVCFPEHSAPKHFDRSNNAAKQLNQKVYHVKFLVHTCKPFVFDLLSFFCSMICHNIFITLKQPKNCLLRTYILILFEVLRSLRMGRGTHHGVGNIFLLTFPCKKVLQSPFGITSFSKHTFITELDKLTFLQNKFHSWSS